jgi:hypothetical protein
MYKKHNKHLAPPNLHILNQQTTKSGCTTDQQNELKMASIFDNYLFKKFKIAICNLGVTIWRNRILQKAPRECNILALRI